jgi:alpha-galactosidase
MLSTFLSSKLALLCSFFTLSHSLNHNHLHKRENNSLALTPPMGYVFYSCSPLYVLNCIYSWNTYNHYSCSPNQDIVFSNAQALVDLGLQAAGYHFVTVDCGWTLPNRSSNGTLQWNSSIFPSGPQALATFLHDRGLGFGVYSDGGIQMCMTGGLEQAGSLCKLIYRLENCI